MFAKSPLACQWTIISLLSSTTTTPIPPHTHLHVLLHPAADPQQPTYVLPLIFGLHDAASTCQCKHKTMHTTHSHPTVAYQHCSFTSIEIDIGNYRWLLHIAGGTLWANRTCSPLPCASSNLLVDIYRYIRYIYIYIFIALTQSSTRSKGPVCNRMAQPALCSAQSNSLTTLVTGWQNQISFALWY